MLAEQPISMLARRTALVLAAGLLLACATAPATGPQSEARRAGDLLLWEVISDTGSAHLLGSMHIGTGKHRYDPAITAAYQGADLLVMEVSAEDLDPTRTVQLLLERGRLEKNQTLRDLLPAETFGLLEQTLEKQGLPVTGYLAMKPWVVVLALASQQFAEAGYVPEQGVDRHFLDQAGSEKPIVGLETAESQFDVFDSMPMELQIDALVGMLDQKEGAPLDPAALGDAWARGDLAALEEIIFVEQGQDEELDAFYEAMYFRRNREMSDRIAELLEHGQRLFVVVGTGHMVGEAGIPALLAARGFDVRRIARTP